MQNKQPQDWGNGNATPIFKKGQRTSCNNYRPVSLTSQIVKIMERCFLDKMNITLQQNDFIKQCQHGFQEKCSCMHITTTWVYGAVECSCTSQLHVLECMSSGLLIWMKDNENRQQHFDRNCWWWQKAAALVRMLLSPMTTDTTVSTTATNDNNR